MPIFLSADYLSVFGCFKAIAINHTLNPCNNIFRRNCYSVRYYSILPCVKAWHFIFYSNRFFFYCWTFTPLSTLCIGHFNLNSNLIFQCKSSFLPLLKPQCACDWMWAQNKLMIKRFCWFFWFFAKQYLFVFLQNLANNQI